MSSAEFEVVFEGPAVQAGRIDAHLLADALAGYSEVFRRANALINGELSEAAVLVESDFKRGSFVTALQLVQNVTSQATNLITAHHFLSADALVALIGFVPAELGKDFAKELAKETVIGLFKWLKRKKPDEVKTVENDKVQIKSGEESKTVNVHVYNLYGDSAIREGLDKLTRPLREADIRRIAVKTGGAEQQTLLEKSEAEYFEAESFQLKRDAEPTEGEREALLVVSKLSFKEGSRWTFFERGATVIAKIEDNEFWQQVHNHEVTFGEGDLLRVRLVWEIRETRSQLKQNNVITRILEILPRPKQMSLNAGRGGDGMLKQPRGRKFR